MPRRITIFFLSLVLLVTIVYLADRNLSYSKGKDPYEYAMQGVSIWKSEGIRFHGNWDVVLPPGFPLVIGLVATVLGNPEWSAKVVSIIAFIISLSLVYRISAFYFSQQRNVNLVMLLYATNSNILVNASSGYSESLFVAVFMLLVWIRLNGLKNNRIELWRTAVFSVLWAWLYYIRPEGLILGGILFAWLLADHYSTAKYMLGVPFICFILIFPYLFFLKQTTGHWQWSGKTYLNLVMGELNSPYQQGSLSVTANDRYTIIDKTQADPSLSKGFLEYWNEKENDITGRIPVNMVKLFKVYGYSFSPLGLLIILMGTYGMRRRDISFLLSMLTPLTILLLFFILGRTVAVYHWIMIIFMANGIIMIEQFISNKWNQKYARVMVYAMTAGIILYQMRSVVKMIYFFSMEH